MKLDNLDQAIAKARQGDYKELATLVYSVNEANGYWDAPRDSIECCTLANTELNEAIEAWRKNKYVGDVHPEYFDGATPQEYKAMYEGFFKDRFQSEIAGTAIRCLDWMGYDKKYSTIEWALLDFDGNVLHDLSDLQEVLLTCKRLERWARTFLPTLLDYATFRGFDLWQFVQWEIRYNAVRGGMKAEGKQA